MEIDDQNDLFVVDTLGDVELTKNPGKKRKIDTMEIDEEEERLERELFNQNNVWEDEEEELTSESRNEEFFQPAWTDEDDDHVKVDVASVARLRKLRKSENENVINGQQYNERLRAQHAKMSRQNADWAKIDEINNELSILRKTAPTIIKGSKLPQTHLDVLRMKDGNIKEVSQKPVNSVKFHPNSQAMLTASWDKTLRLFQIDGSQNNKLQSIFIQDLPMRSAFFAREGHEIIMTGRRPYFYVYDVISGKMNKIVSILGRQENSLEEAWGSPDFNYIGILGNDGFVLLLSQETKQFVTSFKMNGHARSMCFGTDGNTVYSSGGDGTIYHWDVRNNRKCVDKFVDDGSLLTSYLCASPNGKYLAAGSESGVVNIYDLQKKEKTPLKSFMNLTTKITSMEFNSDSQMLVYSSNLKKDNLRMVHVPSLTVFQNWPTSRTPLGTVHSSCFSPNSGLISIGNSKGKALLYKLTHYDKI